MSGAQGAPASPFERIGGRSGISRIVNRFYDLMESEPAFAELRAMHADDLTPMRASLTGFLTGWYGGPRDWFDQHPGKYMMSAHARLDISAATADQWCAAMSRAMSDVDVEEALAIQSNDAFGRMAAAMSARG